MKRYPRRSKGRDYVSVLVRAIRETNLDLEGYFYSKNKELYVYLR